VDDLAQCDDLAPEERGEKARAAFDLYRVAHPGAEIIHLVINLAHLADEETDKGGALILRDALMHHAGERADDQSRAAGTEYPFAVSDIGRNASKLRPREQTDRRGRVGIGEVTCTARTSW
jgi:hypothetical protein